MPNRDAVSALMQSHRILVFLLESGIAQIPVPRLGTSVAPNRIAIMYICSGAREKTGGLL